MKALIKSGNAGGFAAVRPLGSLPPVLSRHEEELNALRQRIAALEKEVQQRDAAIGNLRDEIANAREDGFAQGRKIGLSEAEDRQDARLSLLEKSLARTSADISANLSSLERLSAVLARECLDILLGNPDYRAEIVLGIVETQLAKIDKTILLRIALSAEDFSDEQALKELANRLRLPRDVLAANTDMASGACVMNLRLGQIDVGIDQQWSTLREILGEIASPQEVE